MWSNFLGIIQGFFCLYLLLMNGVFGVDGDEVESVSVMEGDSVTLYTHITELQRDQQIMWQFGPRESRIAEIHKKIIDMYNSNKTFGDRLKLDSQTGSLTITNITITHTGLYKLNIISNRGSSYKRFNVTVYERVITERSHFIPLIAVAVAVVVVLLAVALGVRYCPRKNNKQAGKAQIKEIIYTEPMWPQRFENVADVVEADRTIYSRVIT
nr:uncharacterized protein LOC129453813 isoform X3 [Misgurnus anguillicaudatus]XP_055074174.1 uncharacterized protein LOC129453813 isoform X3 [Misgurnus anguillicaudatus]XP_055074175.1 uncharacterized protein LOC129453813 isoform X3 [Misgurnus anguillicaudatus]